MRQKVFLLVCCCHTFSPDTLPTLMYIIFHHFSLTVVACLLAFVISKMLPLRKKKEKREKLFLL